MLQSMHLQENQSQQYLFVCYSRRDLEQVDHVVAELEKQGHRIWVDRKGITGSQTWRARIVEALCQCQAVLFFGSASSFTSRHVATELTLAEESAKPIVPILLDDAQWSGDMSYFMARPHRLKLNGKDYRQLILEINAALAAYPVEPADPGAMPRVCRTAARSGAKLRWRVTAALAVAGLALGIWMAPSWLRKGEWGKTPELTLVELVPPAQSGGSSKPGVNRLPAKQVVPPVKASPEVPPPPPEDSPQNPVPPAEGEAKPNPRTDPPPIKEPPPQDTGWLVKGTRVEVKIPITPGTLSGPDGKKLILPLSFEKGDIVRISREEGNRIELADAAMGRGWLEKPLALMHLKPVSRTKP